MMKKDIENRDDIMRLVNTFYGYVKADETIGYIFEDVAKVNWGDHLRKMYSFWSSLLLGEHSYSGNPMAVHVALSRVTAMTEKEFAVWLRLFTSTVDELFEGGKANEAKIRGANIARMMQYKIESSGESSFLSLKPPQAEDFLLTTPSSAPLTA